MPECGNKYFNILIREKDFKEPVLEENPVPSNLKDVTEIDEFMLQLPVEKNQKIEKPTLHKTQSFP